MTGRWGLYGMEQVADKFRKAILTKSGDSFSLSPFQEPLVSLLLYFESSKIYQSVLCFILYFLHLKSKLLSYILQITFQKYKILLIAAPK